MQNGLFWDHSKQHSSKTISSGSTVVFQFWDHSKQHSSKTGPKRTYLDDTFWDHSKQHSSKTKSLTDLDSVSFGTIRNNTALKQGDGRMNKQECFGTIRNNTALKPRRIIFLSKFCNRAIRPS